MARSHSLRSQLSCQDLGAEDALLEVDRQSTAGKAPFCLLLWFIFVRQLTTSLRQHRRAVWYSLISNYESLDQVFRSVENLHIWSNPRVFLWSNLHTRKSDRVLKRCLSDLAHLCAEVLPEPQITTWLISSLMTRSSVCTGTLFIDHGCSKRGHTTCDLHAWWKNCRNKGHTCIFS